MNGDGEWYFIPIENQRSTTFPQTLRRYRRLPLLRGKNAQLLLMTES